MDKTDNCLYISFKKKMSGGVRIPVYRGVQKNKETGKELVYYSIGLERWFTGRLRVIVKVNEDGMKIIPALDDECDAYSIKKSKPGVFNGKCVCIKDDLYSVIKKWEHVTMSVVNSAKYGSYIVLKEGVSRTFGKPGDESYSVKLPLRKVARSFYLPTDFVRKNNIRQGDSLPMWQREDGAIIIEATPRICAVCGEKISTYKTPLDKTVCRKCNSSPISSAMIECIERLIKLI